MNILNRIEALRKEREWTIYKLSEESGILQSTLSNMFARKTMPSITTLSNLCEAFGVSLSQFFSEDEEQELLTRHELELVLDYRQLSAKSKKAVQHLVKDLI